MPFAATSVAEIRVPLRHIGSVNAWLLRGDPLTLIDTGPANDEALEALRAGAQDYLLLPMAPDEFLRRINQAIGYFVPPEREASSATA